MKTTFFAGLIAATVLACGQQATAEDIDLFVQPGASGTASAPNVLILLDNTANWSRNVGGQAIAINEIAALVNQVNSLPINTDGTAKVRVGLMLFTETGGSNSNTDGGYVRAAIRDMTAANKTKYMALLNSLDQNGDKSNGGKAGKTFAESYLYLKGGTPASGNGKVKTDYLNNTSGTAASNAIYALPLNALTSKNATQYVSPIGNGSCGKNYIIYISNGAAQDNAADNTTATAQLAAAATAEGIGGATTAIPITPSGSQANVADEWSRFMHLSSLGVTTYTLDVDPVLTGQGPGWSALLKSIATVSSGEYKRVTAGSGGVSISDALAEIFSKIQSVNSVFASVSLPVSVNTEGTYLNQVYIGQFRPDADALPRWVGNLKQYKLKVIGNALKTVDAYEYPDTINPLTGFIDHCSRAFWTPATADTYWQFRPAGDCSLIPAMNGNPAVTVTTPQYSNMPDGNIVEKGAQAYMRRSSTTRIVKTCSSTFGSCTSLVDFNNTNVSQADLGAASTTERDQLINWAKGLDVDDENLNGATDTSSSPAPEMRSTVHGDVVHSRPVAINFGTDVAPKVVVFYGGNDGVLRAVNGNRSAAINSTAAGQEIWAFIPPEFFPQFKRLRDNNTELNYRGTTTTSPTPLPKPYGIDGPMTVYRDSTHTYVFAGMRRGGRVLYAFDVTNIATSPTATLPTLLWKKGCPNLTNDTNCSSDYSGLGQTWSAAKVIKSSGYTSGSPATPQPMLIMGGGYDACEDADPHTCTSSSKGNHIYVMDAATGARLKVFDTDRPVVGDVFVVPDSTTGLITWAYAADTGGNIYRISGNSPTTPINSTDPNNWNITKIASLGCATASSCSTPRKFMFSPDVVNDNGTFQILIGSGDREKPLNSWTSAYGVANYFFMVQDVPTSNSWLSDENSRCSANLMCLASLTSIALGAADPTAADLAGKKGWYLGYNSHEQTVTSAITVFGTVTFSTHTPVPASAGCVSSLGTARVYNVSYKNARSQNGTNNRSQTISGGGLPPSPTAGMVTLDDGSTVPFLIGGDPDSPLQSLLPTGPTVTGQPKAVTFYYIHK